MRIASLRAEIRRLGILCLVALAVAAGLAFQRSQRVALAAAGEQDPQYHGLVPKDPSNATKKKSASFTMMGLISDTMCTASHAKMIEAHKDTKMSDKDCTLACVKAGSKFVFLYNGTIYKIVNQGLAALTKYAGQNVIVTGQVNGDSILISKISASK